MRKKKGPCKAEQWEEALSAPLTGERCAYLKRGKLKKCDYAALIKKIDACIVDNLNAALALFKEGNDDPVEGIYRLEVLTDTVHNVRFFRELSFIRQADRERLESCVKDAVVNFLSEIAITVENENADLVYHISALKGAAGLTRTA